MAYRSVEELRRQQAQRASHGEALQLIFHPARQRQVGKPVAMFQPEAVQKTERQARHLRDASEQNQVDQQGEPGAWAVVQGYGSQRHTPSRKKQNQEENEIDDV